MLRRKKKTRERKIGVVTDGFGHPVKVNFPMSDGTQRNPLLEESALTQVKPIYFLTKRQTDGNCTHWSVIEAKNLKELVGQLQDMLKEAADGEVTICDIDTTGKLYSPLACRPLQDASIDDVDEHVSPVDSLKKRADGTDWTEE